MDKVKDKLVQREFYTHIGSFRKPRFIRPVRNGNKKINGLIEKTEAKSNEYEK